MAVSSPTAQSLGQAIRDLRQARRLTLEALADQTGMNVTYLSDIERGRGNPTIGKLRDVAEALGMRVSELIAKAEDLEID